MGERGHNSALNELQSAAASAIAVVCDDWLELRAS